MGVPCLIFSQSSERASGCMIFKAVVCARKQFFWSKRYVGFVNLFRGHYVFARAIKHARCLLIVGNISGREI